MTRPRKGLPVAFRLEDKIDRVDLADNLTGLRFSIAAQFGGEVLVDYTALSQRRLALAVTRALRGLAEPGGPLGVRVTVRGYVATLPKFFAYLAEREPTLTGPEQLRADHVDGFERWLEGGGTSRTHLFSILVKVVAVLRRIAADEPHLMSADLRKRLSYVSARPYQASSPRDAYSPFVARQLRDAARIDVLAIIRRLRAGPTREDNPAIDELSQAAHAVIADCGTFSYAHPIRRQLYGARVRHKLSAERLTETLHQAHYLTATDLAPILVYLALQTGLEIECCKTLSVDCLRNAAAGAVDVAYMKRRAHGSEHKTLRVRDGGSTTPGGLIRQVIALTAAARRHHPTQSLWVYYRKGVIVDRILHPRQTLQAWTAHHGIVDDQGRPLRLVLSRLRKTHKTLWYRRTEGHVARFAVGHTPEVAARAYADVPALRPLHDRAVADAFEEQVALARGPRIELEPEVPTTEVSPAKMSPPPSGDQDIWLARCGGFYASPHAPAGEACPTPFWGCLDCSNAVITARKLPAILAFQSFVERQREWLDAEEWSAKFGRVHRRITEQVLPAFSEAVVTQARREAASLYLPPEAAL